MNLDAQLDMLYKDRATFKGKVLDTRTVKSYGTDKVVTTYDVQVTVNKEEWEKAGRPTSITVIL